MPHVGSLLFYGTGLDMTSTADQPLARYMNGTDYYITEIIARQRSGGCSVLCLGGIYDGPGKTGNAIVPAAQSWVPLASGVMVVASLAALVQATVLKNTPILSLTTGSTTPCLADVYVYGHDITSA